MRMRLWIVGLTVGGALAVGAWGEPSWLWGARIATPWDYPEGTFGSWEEAVDRAVADGADVILDWSRLSDDWECLFDPCLSRDLVEVAARARYVHEHHPGVRYLIYVAPLEYVTPGLDPDRDGVVDPGEESRSIAHEHPDWLQTGVSGRKAVFFGSQPGMPFWVCPTCEDAWLTPANPDYRALVLSQLAALAETGVDGIWLDVPFLRDSYGEDWEGEWPDVGDDARRLFRAQTGHHLPRPPFLPDWDDPVWLSFVAWRYRLIGSFLADVRAAIEGANPAAELIVESSTGFDAHTTQTAADPAALARVAGAVAHEWGPVRRPAQYYTWLWFLAGLLSWRHVDIAAGTPSWLLSYVEAGHPWTRDLARIHAACVSLTGFSYYTSGNETMSGMPDPAFRRELFSWLAAHREFLYDPGLVPWAEVGVVFSRRTLDFRGRGSWEDGNYADGFYGMLMMLLESHIPFRVVTERDLDRLGEFGAVIAPSWEAMSAATAAALREYVAVGGVLIATGETSLYDEWGRKRGDFALADLFGVHADEVEPWDERVFVRGFGKGRVVFSPTPYEQLFFWAAEPWETGGGDPGEAEAHRRTFLERVWSRAGVTVPFRVAAPRSLIIIPWRRGDTLQVHLLNLTGLRPSAAAPRPARFSLLLPADSLPGRPARFLRFLGAEEPIPGRRAEITLGIRWGGILSLTLAPDNGR